jgi:hypothetical protein
MTSRLGKWLLIPCLLAAAALGCGGLIVKSNPIWIDKVVITGEIDSQGMPVNESEVFTTEQPVVYCFVAGRGSDSIPVRLKWYHGDELFIDQTVNLGPRQHNYGYLRLQPGQHWPPGEYRVEVALVDAPLKTVHFSIRDAP